MVRTVAEFEPEPRWVELLEQDEYWIDGLGRIRRLVDMDRSYCGNVREFLLKQAGGFAQWRLQRMLSGPQPSGDMACDAFDSMTEELMWATRNSQTWMLRKPLLHALQARIDDKPGKKKKKHRKRQIVVVLRMESVEGMTAGDVENAFLAAGKSFPFAFEVVSVSD